MNSTCEISHPPQVCIELVDIGEVVSSHSSSQFFPTLRDHLKLS